MESGLIPPTINFEKPSENIPALAAGRLKVVTELTPWEGNYGAINTASGSGNATHVILKSFKKKKKNGGQPEDDIPRLVMASGRTQEAVESILNDVRIFNKKYSVSKLFNHLNYLFRIYNQFSS